MWTATSVMRPAVMYCMADMQESTGTSRVPIDPMIQIYSRVHG